MGRPVNSIYAAIRLWTERATAIPGVEQNRPTFAPGVEKWLRSVAKTISQEATNWQPAAAAKPNEIERNGQREKQETKNKRVFIKIFIHLE